jgi:hypothetical protein
MTFLNTFVPFKSFVVSSVFAVLIFKRYSQRKGAHLLLWGIGMVFYAIGGLCESYYGAFGWNELVFRAWYLFGAILVAAWLGQGTVYLLVKRKLANILMVILLVASIFMAVKVFTAELDPSLMGGSTHSGGELSGTAIVTEGIRLPWTPIFNSYGTLFLVGGAAYSAWIFYRKRILLDRTVGNVLIALGALSPAFGGIFSRFGLPGALYILELLGAILMFFGFLRSTKFNDEKS